MKSGTVLKYSAVAAVLIAGAIAYGFYYDFKQKRKMEFDRTQQLEKERFDRLQSERDATRKQFGISK